MQNKTITLNGAPKNPCALAMVGHNLPEYGISRGNYVVEKDVLPNGLFQVKAFHVPFLKLDDVNFGILAEWKENLLTNTTEFKALYEYFDEETKQPKDGVRQTYIQDHPSESVGIIPGTGWYKYEGYSLQPTVAGGNMYNAVWRKVVDVFTEIRYGVRCFTDAGAIFQPVLFSFQPNTRTEESDPYQVTVNVTDYEGSALPTALERETAFAEVEYSADGVTYGSSNVLTYANPENAKVYVKDAAGTVAMKEVNASGWVITPTV